MLFISQQLRVRQRSEGKAAALVNAHIQERLRVQYSLPVPLFVVIGTVLAADYRVKWGGTTISTAGPVEPQQCRRAGGQPWWFRAQPLSPAALSSTRLGAENWRRSAPGRSGGETEGEAVAASRRDRRPRVNIVLPKEVYQIVQKISALLP